MGDVDDIRVRKCKECPFIRWNRNEAQCGHIDLPIRGWYDKVQNREDIPEWCPMRGKTVTWAIFPEVKWEAPL